MATPRRTTRAAARASQTPAPEPVAGPSAPSRTPGARRRAEAQATPLPAVPVGTSFAYGSAGRINIQGQVNNNPANRLASNLANLRGRPVAKLIEPRAGPSGRITNSPTAESLPDYEDPDDPAISVAHDDNSSDDNEQREQSEEQVTGGDRSSIPPAPARTIDTQFSVTAAEEEFSYVAPPQVSATSVRGVPAARRTPAVSISVQTPRRRTVVTTPEEIAAATPRPARILYTAVPRFYRENTHYARGLLGLALLIPCLLAFLHFVPGVADVFQNLVDSISQQAELARNASINGTIFDPTLYSRLNQVESDVTNLRIEWSQFKDHLPDQVALHKNPESGELVVPETFYNAFLSQLRLDDTFKSGSSVAWDSFINSNKAQVQSLASTAARAHIDSLAESGVIVSRQTFTHTLNAHSDKLYATLDKLVALHQRGANDAAASAASAAASSVASAVAARRPPSPGKYIEDLTLLTLAQNLDIQRQRNYMNAHVGAAIDRRLTSPTFHGPQPNMFARLWTRYALSNAGQPNPPETALTPWSEAGQCWCAAPSAPHPGKAQLGVVLPRPVRPRALVIEHVPPIGTWDGLSAPREFDVWGQRAPGVAMDSFAPEDFSAECIDGPPTDRWGRPAPGFWVCLGSGTYDVHAANALQRFPLKTPLWPADVTDAPKAVRSEMVGAVLVKTRSNWGRPWTCLYRVRLLGDGEEEVEAELGVVRD